MSIRRCRILRTPDQRTGAGGQFLALKLQNGPSVIYANCFDRNLFADLYAAAEKGEELGLDICESETLNREGKPFLNVVGLDDPRQGLLV